MNMMKVVIDGVHRDRIEVGDMSRDLDEYPETIDGGWSMTVTVVDTDMSVEEAVDALKDKTRFVLTSESNEG